MKTVLLRLSGFAVLPLLSLNTPLLLLPIVSTIVGGEGVSSVISGQAIGTFAATVLMWGWNVEGPVAIARAADDSERRAIYAQSMRMRVTLLAVVIPVVVVVIALVAVPSFRLDAIWMGLATAMAGMSPAWFCIGLGRPKLLAAYDTVPRFLATVVAAPLLLATGQLWLYTALLALTTVIALVAFHRRFARAGRWFPTSLGESLRLLRQQGNTAGINVAGSAYASTPAPIATVTSPPLQSGSLSTADTLYRFGIFTVVALGNAFQSWVIEPGIANRRERHRLAMWAHAVLGVAGGAILTGFGPWVSELLFAGEARATPLVCFFYGLSFFFLSASTPLIRNMLIPAGRQPLVLRWTLFSAVSGVAAMVTFGLTGFSMGIPLGMAFSEAALFVALLAPALREIRTEERPMS